MDRRKTLGWIGCALLVFAWASGATANSATAMAEPGVVEIETNDEDGDVRKTPIWIVSDGKKVYVRTTDSNWNANLVREGRATLHSDGGAAAAGAIPVADDALRASVNALFAEKYGFSNTLRNAVVSFGTANMWELTLDAP